MAFRAEVTTQVAADILAAATVDPDHHLSFEAGLVANVLGSAGRTTSQRVATLSITASGFFDVRSIDEVRFEALITDIQPPIDTITLAVGDTTIGRLAVGNILYSPVEIDLTPEGEVLGPLA